MYPLSFHFCYSNPLDFLLLLILVQSGTSSSVLLSTLRIERFAAITRCSPCSVLLSKLDTQLLQVACQTLYFLLSNYSSSCLKQSNFAGKLHRVIHYQCPGCSPFSLLPAFQSSSTCFSQHNKIEITSVALFEVCLVIHAVLL